jgi:predicted ArsR family transcriptional regulator
MNFCFRVQLVNPVPDLERRIAAIAALDQPLRRDLYRLLVQADGWTTRDQAAEALGVPRSVAAFHLDKLAGAGVVEVRFERMTGRTGPGAGRPSKLYRPSRDELSASVPERHYDLAGSLLAAAVAEATRSGAPVADCLAAAARAAGRQIGEEAVAVTGELTRSSDRRGAVVELLGRHGYAPEVGKRREIALTNCPFHRLAEEQRTLVCGMNLDFLAGLLEGTGPDDRLTARLAPEPGYCCVRIATT